MSGYAATARLTRAPIRPGPSLRSGQPPIDPQELIEWVVAGMSPTSERHRLPLAERLHYVRESWSQMTFYLFDPESWR